MLSIILAFLMTLFGIGPAPVEPDPDPVPWEAQVAVGESQLFEVGSSNQSARRQMTIVTGPDEAVATVELTHDEAAPGCAPGGCEEPAYITVTGVAPGKTSVEVRLCFVESPGECQPLDEPVTIGIIVNE